MDPAKTRGSMLVSQGLIALGVTGDISPDCVRGNKSHCATALGHLTRKSQATSWCLGRVLKHMPLSRPHSSPNCWVSDCPVHLQ